MSIGGLIVLTTPTLARNVKMQIQKINSLDEYLKNPNYSSSVLPHIYSSTWTNPEPWYSQMGYNKIIGIA